MTSSERRACAISLLFTRETENRYRETILRSFALQPKSYIRNLITTLSTMLLYILAVSLSLPE